MNQRLSALEILLVCLTAAFAASGILRIMPFALDSSLLGSRLFMDVYADDVNTGFRHAKAVLAIASGVLLVLFFAKFLSLYVRAARALEMRTTSVVERATAGKAGDSDPAAQPVSDRRHGRQHAKWAGLSLEHPLSAAGLALLLLLALGTGAYSLRQGAAMENELRSLRGHGTDTRRDVALQRERLDGLMQESMVNANAFDEELDGLREGLRVLSQRIDRLAGRVETKFQASLAAFTDIAFRTFARIEQHFVDVDNASVDVYSDGAAKTFCSSQRDFAMTARGAAFVGFYYAVGEALYRGKVPEDVWLMPAHWDRDAQDQVTPRILVEGVDLTGFIADNRPALRQIAERHEQLLRPLVSHLAAIHRQLYDRMPAAASYLSAQGDLPDTDIRYGDFCFNENVFVEDIRIGSDRESVYYRSLAHHLFAFWVRRYAEGTDSVLMTQQLLDELAGMYGMQLQWQ